MKKLLFSSILEFNELKKEASSTLLYSLMMPHIEVISYPSENWLEVIIDQCNAVCKETVFTEGPLFNPYLNGNDHSSLKENSDVPFISYDFFEKTIMVHCIMVAYDTTLQLLSLSSKENSLSDYKLANTIKGKGYNEQKLLNKKNGAANSVESKSAFSSSIASGYTQKVNSHKKVLIESGFLNIFFNNDTLLPFQSDIFYRLLNKDARLLKTFLSLYHYDASVAVNAAQKSKNLKIIQAFNKYLNDTFFANNVDRLYYLYKTENYFGMNLANCMLQEIQNLTNDRLPLPYNDSNFEDLAFVSQYPNVFSRSLYLQYMFEYVRVKPKARNDYFAPSVRPDLLINIALFKDSFDINQWTSDFKNFSLFLIRFAFPVYEWYFLLTLWESLGDFPLQEKLQILQNELSLYIEKHHERIEQPEKIILNTDVRRLKCFTEKNIIKPRFDLHMKPNIEVSFMLSSFRNSCQQSNVTYPLSELGSTYFLSFDNNESNFKIRRKKFLQQYIDVTLNT